MILTDLDVERFWEKVIPEPNSGCHLWIGARFQRAYPKASGYGEVNLHGRILKAHRVAWFLATGRWPDLNVLHKCDTPPCVRFDHLFEGTQLDNMKDCASKGRHAHGEGSNVPYGESSPNAVLTAADVVEIRRRISIGESQRPVAAAFNISRAEVRRIIAGTVWRRLGVVLGPECHLQ